MSFPQQEFNAAVDAFNASKTQDDPQDWNLRLTHDGINVYSKKLHPGESWLIKGKLHNVDAKILSEGTQH